MRIELLGQSFTIRSDEDPEYLEDLVDYFATKLQEVRDSVDTTDPVKLAILAGLITVDELFQAREEAGLAAAPSDHVAENHQELERITERLITRLNEALDAPPTQQAEVHEDESDRLDLASEEP